MAEEVGKGVFLLSLPGPSANCYVLRGRGAARAVVDPGLCEKSVFEKSLASLGVELTDVSSVFLTHCHLDHSHNIKWLENAVVYLGAGTLDALRKRKEALFPEIDFVLPANEFAVVKDGDVMECGGMVLKCISAPGHTADSTCFFEKTNKILFSGDALFPTRSFGAVPRIFSGSVAELVETYKKLGKLGAKILASGHYPPSMDFSKELGEARRAAEALIQ